MAAWHECNPARAYSVRKVDSKTKLTVTATRYAGRGEWEAIQFPWTFFAKPCGKPTDLTRKGDKITVGDILAAAQGRVDRVKTAKACHSRGAMRALSAPSRGTGCSALVASTISSALLVASGALAAVR